MYLQTVSLCFKDKRIIEQIVDDSILKREKQSWSLNISAIVSKLTPGSPGGKCF